MSVEQLRVESSKNVEVTGTEIKERQTTPVRSDVMDRVEKAGAEIRELIVLTKRLPREGGFESHQDPARSLSLAQSHLQTGFMWLRRAIENPKVF